MYRIVSILITVFFWGHAALASPDTLKVSQIVGELTLDPYLSISSNDPIPDSLRGAIPIIANEGNVHKARLTVFNDLNDTVTVFLNLWGNEYWVLNREQSMGSSSTQKAGWLTPLSKASIPHDKYSIKVELPPGQMESWELSTWNTSTYTPRLEGIEVLDSETYYLNEDQYYERSRVPMALSLICQGAMWIMMLYMLLLYFQNNRDKIYLYYGLYLFFAMYYLLQKVASAGPFYFLFAENPIVRNILNEPSQWMIYVFYNLFVIHFLQIPRFSKQLYKLMIAANVVYIVYMVGESTFFMLTFDRAVQNDLFVISRVVVTAISVYFIIHTIVVVWSPLLKYIVAGSAFFIGLSVIAMLYSLRLEWLPEVDIYPINFMHIGILGEMLLFSLGLGKRINLLSHEKEKVQQAYIDQLERTEQLVKESNKRLSDEVFKRTNEIIYKSKELEKEREQKLKSEYDRQLMESEMNSLRLQMNPHFIFNSLNSIRYYILKEDSEKASDYITAFSKLLRMILQHSRERTIKLQDDLQALKLYIEFERKRFENKFSFELDVSDSVDTATISIQPMLIQPFVENSIWHGLLHKEGEGHLTVRVDTEDGFLKILVEDDGIGREQSRVYNAEKSSTYKSMGMQITKDRLKMMAKSQKTEAGYEIVDLVNADGSAAGTRVILKIKIL